MTNSSSSSTTAKGKRFVPDFADRSKYSELLNESLLRLDAIPGQPRSKELRRIRAKQSVHPTYQILSRLQHPQRHLKTIHVTGSKGKGSTSAMIASALRISPFSSEQTIGLYNSPHLDRVNERVRLNGKPVGDHIFAEAIAAAMDAKEKTPIVEYANRFNILFAAALRIFEKQNCSWSVVEVGIGGRGDATNVISAPVSLITNIYLEHADVIGPTLEDIAFEKAGIIAPDSTVIVGMDDSDKLANIFKEQASELSPPAHVVFVPHEEGASIFEQNLKLSREVMKAVALREGVNRVDAEELLPESVAREAVEVLGGRNEHCKIAVDGSDIPVIFDIAHVAESVDLVLREFQMSVGKHNGGKKPVVVIGLGRDKSMDRIASVLYQRGIECVGTCPVGQNEYLAAQDWIATEMRSAGIREVRSFDNVRNVLEWALRLARIRETYVVVLGSKLVADGRRELQAMRSSKDFSHN